MNDVKIKISVDEKEAVADIGKVGSAFDRLAGDAKKASSGTQKLKTESNGALLALKGFVTLEMGKKVFAFADATLRGAQAMQGLSAETKKAAESYTIMMDNVGRIGQGITLWGASLLSAKGEMGFIGKLVSETADAWAYIAGVQSKATTDDAKANEKALANAKMVALRAELRAISKQEEQLSATDESQFANTVRETASQASKALREYGKTLGLTSDQIQAFAAGQSMAVVTDKAYRPVSTPSGTISKKANVTATKRDDSEFWSMIDEQQKAREDDAEAQKEMERDLVLYKIRKNKELVESKKRMDDDLEQQRKEDKEAEIEAVAAGFGATAQLASSLAQLQQVNAGKNKEQVKIALGLSQIAAIANTAEGITKAYAQGGVLGFVTGTAVGIAGTAQVAAIEQQKQKLADGGIIRGQSFGDTVQVQANGGEMMLTKSQQAQLFNMASNGGVGGGGHTINYAPQYSTGVTSIQKKRDYLEFAKVVKSVQSNRNYSRLNGAMV